MFNIEGLHTQKNLPFLLGDNIFLSKDGRNELTNLG
jgi:hypothetical protein